jgi:hypothetical protein
MIVLKSVYVTVSSGIARVSLTQIGYNAIDEG